MFEQQDWYKLFWPQSMIMKLQLHLSQIIGKFAHTANPLAIEVEQERCWKQCHAEERKQSRCPLDAHALEHICSEQRKSSREDATHEAVGRVCRVGIEKIDVDDVNHAAHEDHNKTSANEDTTDDLRPGRDTGEARPGEPEEADNDCEGDVISVCLT